MGRLWQKLGGWLRRIEEEKAQVSEDCQWCFPRNGLPQVAVIAELAVPKGPTITLEEEKYIEKLARATADSFVEHVKRLFSQAEGGQQGEKGEQSDDDMVAAVELEELRLLVQRMCTTSGMGLVHRGRIVFQRKPHRGYWGNARYAKYSAVVRALAVVVRDILFAVDEAKARLANPYLAFALSGFLHDLAAYYAGRADSCQLLHLVLDGANFLEYSLHFHSW